MNPKAYFQNNIPENLREVLIDGVREFYDVLPIGSKFVRPGHQMRLKDIKLPDFSKELADARAMLSDLQEADRHEKKAGKTDGLDEATCDYWRETYQKLLLIRAKIVGWNPTPKCIDFKAFVLTRLDLKLNSILAILRHEQMPQLSDEIEFLEAKIADLIRQQDLLKELTAELEHQFSL